MRSSFTLALGAIALGLGTVAASAAPDLNQLAPAAPTQPARVPDPSMGRFESGFKAIKAQPGSSLKDDSESALKIAPTGRDAHLLPDEGSWKKGLSSASAFASLTPPSKDATSEAHTPPADAAAHSKGMAGLKAGAGKGAALKGDQSIIVQRSGSALQLPEGEKWSNGVKAIRTRR